jgi:hypothetical protein
LGSRFVTYETQPISLPDTELEVKCIIPRLEDILTSNEAKLIQQADRGELPCLSCGDAAEVAKDMETFRQDFEGRRRLIEMLDVNITLVVENGQKVAYAQSKLGDKSLSIVPKSTRTNITLNSSIG